MLNSINTCTPQKNYRQNNKTAQTPQKLTFQGKKLDEFYSRIANKQQTKNALFKIANSKLIRGIVEWAAKPKTILEKGEKITTTNADDLPKYLMVTYSAALQTNHIYNILKNDQMPQERKETLVVNNALAFVLPTIGAFTIDNSINRGVKKFQKYAEKTKNTKFNETQLKGLKTIKSVLIFGLMYKYFATIITTPMADKVTDFLREKGIIGKKRKLNETKKESTSAKTSKN